MHRIAPLVLAVLLAAGCSPTRIPPLPESFDTVVVTSTLSADALYADGLAAFIRANWEPVAPDEEGLVITILPDGTQPEPDSAAVVVRVRVERLGAPEPDGGSPDLADPDYGVPDLARRELEDPSREQNDPDSARAALDPPPITQGDAVLTATVDLSKPGARQVLVRTAKILAGVRGELSYR